MRRKARVRARDRVPGPLTRRDLRPLTGLPGVPIAEAECVRALGGPRPVPRSQESEDAHEATARSFQLRRQEDRCA